MSGSGTLGLKFGTVGAQKFAFGGHFGSSKSGTWGAVGRHFWAQFGLEKLEIFNHKLQIFAKTPAELGHNTLLNSSLNRTTHTMTIPLDVIPIHLRVTQTSPPPPPPQYVRRYLFIHLGVVKHYDSEVSCTRTQHSHPSRACTRTFTIRCQNTDHRVTTPPIYYLGVPWRTSVSAFQSHGC